MLLPVFINSSGTSNRDNGYFPFTASKTATGVFYISFNNVWTGVVYACTNLSGYSIYQKLLNIDMQRNYLYNFTGTSNLNITKTHYLIQ